MSKSTPSKSNGSKSKSNATPTRKEVLINESNDKDNNTYQMSSSKNLNKSDKTLASEETSSTPQDDDDYQMFDDYEEVTPSRSHSYEQWR